MSKSRIKKPVVNAANLDIEAIVRAIAGNKNIEREITAKMDEDLQRVREHWQAQLGPAQTALEILTADAQVWAEAHPEKFAKRKSLELTHGTIGFRTGTPKLKTMRGWTWDRVLERLKAGYVRYVRIKEEVNRDLILGDAGALSELKLAGMGVAVVQDETFFVEPKLTEVETRTATTSPKKEAA